MSEYIEREAAIAETRKPRLTDAELRRRLAQIPAADVREVKRGKWKAHEAYKGAAWSFWECSVCGDKSWTIKHNYCPNCGARMEES